MKRAGLLAISGCVLPSALVLHGLRRQPAQAPQRHNSALVTALLQLARAEVAEQFCLAESRLFQARRARSCTVVYDDQARLAELRLPEPRATNPTVTDPAVADPALRLSPSSARGETPTAPPPAAPRQIAETSTEVIPAARLGELRKLGPQPAAVARVRAGCLPRAARTAGGPRRQC